MSKKSLVRLLVIITPTIATTSPPGMCRNRDETISMLGRAGENNRPFLSTPPAALGTVPLRGQEKERGKQGVNKR